jgi:hypothetical protein
VARGVAAAWMREASHAASTARAVSSEGARLSRSNAGADDARCLRRSETDPSACLRMPLRAAAVTARLPIINGRP